MITQHSIIQYDIIWYDRVRERIRKKETRISRNNLEKIIMTMFLHVNSKEESDTKKVRMREGEEKRKEKVKKSY